MPHNPPKITDGSISEPGFTLRAVLLCVLSLECLKHSQFLTLAHLQPWPDSSSYWQLAKRVAQGDVWLWNVDVASRTPGYLWFLAPFTLSGDVGPRLVVVVQMLATMATSALLAYWVWQMTRSSWATVAAYGLAVCSTARPLYANFILTETLATLLLLLAAYTIHQGLNRTSALYWAALATGVGLLVRPSLIVLVPVLIVASLYVAWRRGTSWYRRIAIALGPLLLIALIVSPWCLRNAYKYDRFTLVVFTGRELWTTTFSPWPGAQLEVPADGAGLELRTQLGPAAQTANWAHNWSVSDALTRSGLNDAQADALMERVAWQAVARQPRRALFHVGARCLTFWYVKDWPLDWRTADPQTFPPLPRDQNRRLIPPLWLPYTPEQSFPAMWLASGLSLLSVLVLLVRPSQRSLGGMLLAIFAGTTLLTAVLEIPLYRYRVPLEPLMIVAFVMALHELQPRRGISTSVTPGQPD